MDSLKEMIKHTIFKLFLSIYSVLWNVLECVCSLFNLLGMRDRKSTHKRSKNSEIPTNGVVCFCSSAGEYEQALPILQRLEKQGYGISIVFFSYSGLHFATSRGETFDMVLFPGDSYWFWRRFFAERRPVVTLVVRHELWPGFMWASKEFGRLYWIDGTQPSGQNFLPLRNLVRRFLGRLTNGIFVIWPEDELYFNKLLGGSVPIQFLGDSKFDRVYERSLERLTVDLGVMREREWSLVCGSVWEADVELIIEFLKLWLRLKEDKLSIIIVPHEPSRTFCASLVRAFGSLGLRVELLSSIATKSIESIDICIVDRLGLLAELYSLGECTYVGGAQHNQVHNVLEPAIYGKHLASGPLIVNSPEAIRMASVDVLTIVETAEDFFDWLEQSRSGNFEGMQLLQFVQNQLGASDRIVRQMDLGLL